MSDSLANKSFRDIYQNEYIDPASYTRRKYVMTMMFDEQLFQLTGDAQMVMEKLKGDLYKALSLKLAKEGYPEDSYRVEYMVDEDPTRLMRRLTGVAIVDERMRMKTIYLDTETDLNPRFGWDAPKTVATITADEKAAKEVLEASMGVILKIKRSIKLG